MDHDEQEPESASVWEQWVAQAAAHVRLDQLMGVNEPLHQQAVQAPARGIARPDAEAVEATRDIDRVPTPTRGLQNGSAMAEPDRETGDGNQPRRAQTRVPTAQTDVEELEAPANEGTHLPPSRTPPGDNREGPSAGDNHMVASRERQDTRNLVTRQLNGLRIHADECPRRS